MRIQWFIVCCLITPMAHASGGILTDGTVGPQQTLSGTLVTIPQTLGQTVGKNLFHSFTQFNIDGGQTVLFTEQIPNTLDNVIARVTGTSPSDINGTLRSTPGGHADFYLINPQGVTFGAGAQIDVPAAFHASTADQLQLQDGAVYSASHPAVSTLTSAAPAAFGFLASTATNNSLLDSNNTQWTAPTGKTIDLTAKNITIENNTTLTAPAGEIRMVAVGPDAINVPVSPGKVPTTQGTLSIDSSILDTSGNGAGQLIAHSGNMSITNSILSADNTGSSNASSRQGIMFTTDDGDLWLENALITAHAYGTGNAAPTTIAAQGNLTIAGGATMSSITYDTGKGGNIAVSSGGAITIDDNGVGSGSGVYTLSAGNGNGQGGNAGMIAVQAQGNITLRNGGKIFSATESTGQSGNIAINSDGTLLVNDQNTGLNTGVYSASDGNATGAGGDAGAVSVSAHGNLTIENGGQIGSTSWSTGKTGSVTITSGGTLTVDGQGTLVGTGIYSTTNGNDTGAGGDAGTIQVTSTGDMVITRDAEISSTTVSTGKSGSVIINSGGALTVDGQGFTGWQTSIDSTSAGNYNGVSGDTGTVRVTSRGNMTINNGGEIHTLSVSSGNAGNVIVYSGGTLLVNGQSSPLWTGIDAQVNAGTTSNAGSVSVITTGTLTVENGGEISSSIANGTGNTGNVLLLTNDSQTVPVGAILSPTNGTSSMGGSEGVPCAARFDCTASGTGSLLTTDAPGSPSLPSHAYPPKNPRNH